MKKTPSLVILRMESGDLIRIIEIIRYTGISVYDLQFTDELTARFAVRYHDFDRVQKIAERNHCVLSVSKRVGLIWMVQYAIHRKVLLVGCLLLCLLTLLIPTRVLFISVEGNQRIETRKILEAVEKAGIRLGVSRRAVRSERVKNALLELMPELQWAGVMTEGCVARISLREKNSYDKIQEKTSASKVIAVRDGVVTSCTASSGNLLCDIGQTVVKGETLISGYTDCGDWIKRTDAEGEVFARTRRNIDTRFPNMWLYKKVYDIKKRSYSVIIGKKRINLCKDSGIYNGTYDRIYKEYYVMLHGGFQLPLAFAVETCYLAHTQTKEILAEEITAWLQTYSERYLLTQMIAGEIQWEQVNILTQMGVISLTGEYGCTEMIGRVQREEIGEMYE